MDAKWSNNTESNETHCIVHSNDSTAKIYFIVYYFALLIIGSGGNILALHLSIKRRKKVNSTDIYLINLALSDALFTLSLPGRITYYILDFNWPFGEAMCKITAFIFYTNTYVGIYFMTCVSVDRYIAVVHALRFGKFRKDRIVKYVCPLVWFLVLVQTMPLLFIPMTNVIGDKVTCMEYFNFETIPQLPVILLVACIVSYFFPVGVILLCYLRITLKLCKTVKENQVIHKKGHLKTAFTVIMVILVSIVLSFSPYHINITQFMVKRLYYKPSCSENKAFKMSLQITVALMNLNCCLDPVIYFFAFKGYRNRILSMIRSYVSAPSLPTGKTHSESNSNSQNQVCTKLEEL
ncbi:G- coupled receptor 183-like [Pelobates cultripes]|uniref:G- coupled receptor 183-like n=1 Tax=Pelobates cultripes TaxID=61616 RepID=A0AAD1VL57_PELCU|nr:G- coupled receptor 183-like [Pelobates cultripes]